MFMWFGNLKHRCSLISALLCLFFAFVSLVSAPGAALAASSASQSNFVFILDSSGSMNAKIQNRVKMDIAKEAMSGLIKDLPAGVNVGLVAYGHRQKADCNDVEELVSLSPINKDALLKGIQALTPKGKTPITISVRQVAEKLKTIEDEVTIVLVSDGEETCEGDPCALVKELKSSGIKFVMHVIGFDVSEKEKAQLSCIADAGGGSYFSAKNAGELSVAAKKTVQKVETVQKPEPVKKPERSTAATLKVKALRNGKPLRVFCTVTKSGNDGEEKEPVTDGWVDLEGTAFKLPPGTYDIKVQNEDDANRPVISFTAITLEAGKTLEKVADFTGGVIKIKATRNGKPLKAFCTIIDAADSEDKKQVTDGWIDPEGTAFKLTPGVYDIKVQNEDDSNRPIVSFTAITLEAGKTVEKIADFSGGTLRVKALRNGKPFKAYCAIFKVEEGEEDREPVTDGWIEPDGTAFKLIPGVYEIQIENGEDVDRPSVNFTAISIEAGKSVEKVAEFTGGTIKIKASKNGKPFKAYFHIYKTGEDEEHVQVTDGWVELEGTSLKITPGVYDIKFENVDLGVEKLVEAVTVEAGKAQNVDAQF